MDVKTILKEYERSKESKAKDAKQKKRGGW